MRRRLMAVLTAMAVVMAGLCVRLYTISNSGLRAASYQQSTAKDTIAVSRGTIYDRYLQPLVNRERHIWVSVAPFSESRYAIEKELRGVLRQEVSTTLSQGERALVRMDHWMPPTLGIVQITAPERYGADSLACHVVGYVNDEGNGVNGMEKVFNDQLVYYSGEASVSYPIDALGHISSCENDTLENTLDQAVGGVALTLDAEIQHIVEKEASLLIERGAVLVTDAENGEVLACVSLPLYDQNKVEEALLSASSPLLDRTRLNYNLGSVFKILVAAAALENGFNVNKAYTCKGFVEVDGHRFYCHNKLGDGRLTMGEAMARSCNCYFIQLALEVGAGAVYDMAVKAGFSDAVSLVEGYDTASGILTSRRDLSADAALANLAIGQGDLLITPYHAAYVLQAVAANGSATAPSLFYGTVDENGVLTHANITAKNTRLFSEKTAKSLRAMLEAVVEYGTGTAAAPLEGTAAGKTGTAQTGWEQDGEEVVQSWFAGYYPAKNPQYVITVLSENGGANGKIAAPVFAAVANALFEAGLVKNE